MENDKYFSERGTNLKEKKYLTERQKKIKLKHVHGNSNDIGDGLV